MAKRSKFYSDAKAEWEKKNTYFFTTRLQNSTDADIIERLEAAPSRQGELKRLIRLGIAYEKNGADPTLAAQPEPLPEAYLKAINPEPDPETEKLIRFGKEYLEALQNGWVLVEKKRLVTQEEKTKVEEPRKPMFDKEAILAAARKRRAEEYAEKRAAALAEDASRVPRMDFAEWLMKAMPERWNGKCFDIDEGLTLWPVIKQTRYPNGSTHTETIDYKVKTQEDVEKEAEKNGLSVVPAPVQ